MVYFLFLIIASIEAFDVNIHSNYLKLPPHNFVEYFNSLNLTYKIGHTKLNHKHCSFIGHDPTYPKIHHDVSALDLPDTFDAREKWSQCASIGKIFNQQTCGSCWMFGTAMTASDRNCIHANINVDLSEQDLSCCTDCTQSVCNGGFPQKAFEFWINQGLVSNDCQPYDSNALINNQYCSQQCVNGKDYNQDKNHGGRVYGVSADEEQIKAELYKNGPIEATMTVFDDLESYTDGIYIHTHGNNRGLHSVRLIGYGEEGGVKYWLLANSWGTEKGENGFYRVKQFQPEIGIEDNLIAAMPNSQFYNSNAKQSFLERLVS